MIRRVWLPRRPYVVVFLGASAASLLQAQDLTTLYQFCTQFSAKAACTDGAYPTGIVLGTDGNFYGMTDEGGVHGVGTVFKITLSGALTTLYTFCSQAGCTDGQYPLGGLVEGTDGNFYGTTQYGGGTGCDYGCGTVFKITPSGTLTTLYRFCSESGCADGAEPAAGLVQASDGYFYGTTAGGGINNTNVCFPPSAASGCGTVFKITPTGKLTTLYTFCSQSGCTDGGSPYAGLVRTTDGDFIGTTQDGGTAYSFGGTIFKITPSGTLTTLHSFCALTACADGQDPAGGLVRTANGDIYGTTVGGGVNFGGTVFKLASSGALTTLYSFCAQADCTDGYVPAAGLIRASNGNFFGTTDRGGSAGVNGYAGGTVFKITPSGKLTTLYRLHCDREGICPHGQGPGGLLQLTDGNFYGTTGAGGASGLGTLFSLSLGLGPLVETQAGFGK